MPIVIEVVIEEQRAFHMETCAQLEPLTSVIQGIVQHDQLIIKSAWLVTQWPYNQFSRDSSYEGVTKDISNAHIRSPTLKAKVKNL